MLERVAVEGPGSICRWRWRSPNEVRYKRVVAAYKWNQDKHQDTENFGVLNKKKEEIHKLWNL